MRINPATFLPHLKGLRFDRLNVMPERITLTVSAVRPTARCPLCHQPSATVHSYYTRTVADLPWSGRQVRLQVQTRRFVCRVAACRRRIFCERLTPFVAAYGRRTHGLRASLEQTGLALGGRAGARYAATQGTPARRQTLLRLVRAVPPPAAPAPTVVGVDDWARRKGRTYAAIVCDLERHRPLDLLPDATADMWAAWLTAHPTVQVVSRDRGQQFAEGTTRGAPQATQVADRWHPLASSGAPRRRVSYPFRRKEGSSVAHLWGGD
jgi:transposase